MPVYEYQCTVCGHHESRLGGLDDAFAVCVENGCQGLMIRLDSDLLTPYFTEPEPRPQLTLCPGCGGGEG